MVSLHEGLWFDWIASVTGATVTRREVGFSRNGRQQMNDSGHFKIDLSEVFPHLSAAPIVEAVIQLTCRPELPWEEPSLRDELRSRLPEFPNFKSQVRFHGEFAIEAGVEVEQTVRSSPTWAGIRGESSDGLHIAQFNRDGFVFSRLHPYENWDRLVSEALRLWIVFIDLARPTEVNRIGVRFINRISLSASGIRLKEYVRWPPASPDGLTLPVAAFLHQETLNVVGYPYVINLIRTIQPPQPDGGGPWLILDIDVFTTTPTGLDLRDVQDQLTEMRWLKNKAFFGSLTSEAVERFK